MYLTNIVGPFLMYQFGMNAAGGGGTNTPSLFHGSRTAYKASCSK